MGGCVSSFETHRMVLRELHEQGAYREAARTLDDAHEQGLYQRRNEVLWNLDRGALALKLGDGEGAIEALDAAEALMERQRRASAGETLGTLLINDRQAPYLGEPYEQMYVNVLKMAAHFKRGVIAGGATVEARRMATKASQLRDEHLRYEERARRALPDGVDASLEGLGDYARVNESGAFVESPLGVFLTLLSYMKSGDPSNQAVAGRRLIEAIETQGGLIGPVAAASFEGLGDAPPGSVNALVIAFAGRGPAKRAQRFGPVLVYLTPVYFELPVLEWAPSVAAQARVVVDDAGEGSTVGELPLIEDLSSVANENHRRRLPLIYMRTLIRAAAKSVGATFAAEAVRRETDNTALAALAALGGLAAIAATERADTRGWETLPGRAFVGLMRLPEGVRRVRVEYLDERGAVAHATPWREIEVRDDGLATIVEHYWR